ncbi:hypothetical protein [Agrobacterium tumefaciens]|uniref:hypothetical protein n=1 Tax=Agrobacterium tumefaciens TaxID=358 RepID=UPI001571E109|nr:hypothetical protein [Agrobacterium tumefaciens]
MALKQSPWALGSQMTVRPQTAGAVHSQRFTYDVTSAAAALAVGDIVEIGELPPYAYVVDALVFTEGVFTGATADIGLMSGEYGFNDAARTSGNEMFAAVDLAAASTAVARLAKPAALLLGHTEQSRGIGVKIAGAAVAAAAGKKIHVILFFRQ